MKRFKISGILLTLGTAIVAVYFVWALIQVGTFRELAFHSSGPCRPVLGMYSSEDIVIAEDRSEAFISSLDRRIPELGEPIPGQILLLDLNNPDASAQDSSGNLNFPFFPHGLGLWNNPQGESLVFAVNHGPEEDSIEIFERGAAGLIPVESISGELLFNANDVAPVGERTFYVTRDHASRSSLGRKLEDYLLLQRSSVLFYDGSEFRLVADGIGYANGIVVSHDGFTVFVAATTENSVLVYSRDPASGDLSLRQRIPVETGVDNLTLDPEGNLWLAGHPQLLTFLEYAADPDRLAPSQALRISFAEPDSPTIEEIHLSDGTYLSGASVAAPWKNLFLLGSVYDRRLLICEMAQQPMVDETD
ncbi:MAG: SMP-30/gluconolactonase/LRE family protein [Acidobacteriota bacterium]|nr:MAG: SMP-30/gluconolactonase/LRE family protein [Acidobacteriota bacterium]